MNTNKWKPSRKQIKTILTILGGEYSRLHPFSILGEEYSRLNPISIPEDENAEVGFRRRRISLMMLLIGVSLIVITLSKFTAWGWISFSSGVVFALLATFFFDRTSCWPEWDKRIRKLILKRSGEFWIFQNLSRVNWEGYLRPNKVWADEHLGKVAAYTLVNCLSWHTAIDIAEAEIKPVDASANWKPYHPDLDNERRELEEISLAFENELDWQTDINDAKSDLPKWQRIRALGKRNMTRLKWKIC